MKKIIFALFIGILGFASTLYSWDAESTKVFQDANVAYREGKLSEAVTGYEELAHKLPDSAIVFYNLGNSYYRSKKMGPAIWAYERALTLDPRNADIRYNLEYVRGLLEYRIEDKRNWYIRAGDEFLRYFRESEVTFILAIAYFLFIASWAFVLFFRPETEWGWKRKFVLGLLAVSILFWGAKSVQTDFMRDAIVFGKEIEVRYGPSRSDQVAFRLGQGLKVHVLEKRSEWSRVLLANLESGWVQNSQIMLVSPEH